MSTEEAMIAGAEADGVYIVHRRERFPIAGTRAEKRAERTIAAIFLLGFLAAVGFIVVFCGAVPFEWQLPGEGSQNFRYFTPLLGGLLGLSLAAIGIGVVLWAKWLLPEEEVVQDRHDGPSDADRADPDRRHPDVRLQGHRHRPPLDAQDHPRPGRRRARPGAAGGPGRRDDQEAEPRCRPEPVPHPVGPGRAAGRTPTARGSARTTCCPAASRRCSPGVAGGVQAGDSPTLLIRLRPGQTVKARKGQEGFGWGDFVAYSKICTHAGCPASLYEQQTGRLLCPCHQSQFEVLEDAKPVFGPATRSLPKLPLGRRNRRRQAVLCS